MSLFFSHPGFVYSGVLNQSNSAYPLLPREHVAMSDDPFGCLTSNISVGGVGVLATGI